MKTLKEVEKIVGLKRRAIQEYEEVELAIKPMHRNKYGHLLYGEQEIERLWQLRFYKELGYNMPQIKEIITSDNYDEKIELEKVIIALKEKREALDNMISIAQVMQETGLSFNSLRHSVPELDVIQSDKVFDVLGTVYKLSIQHNFEDIINIDILTEEMIEGILSVLDKIFDDYDLGKEVSDKSVQEKFTTIHKMLFDVLSESVLFLQIPVLYLAPECELAQEFAEEIGMEKVLYLRDGLQYYCKINENNPSDNELKMIFDNIERFGREKFTTNSVEVQEEVRKLYEFFGRINLLTEPGKINMLKYFSELFGSKAYREAFDRGAKRGIAWFCSRAIEIYCSNLS